MSNAERAVACFGVFVCLLFSLSSSCEKLLRCSFLTYQLYSFVFS